jgi:hypothetical protein
VIEVAMATRAGRISSGVARLAGKPERRNDAAKLPRTRTLPRTSERRRKLNAAMVESGRLKAGKNLEPF